MVRRWTAHGDLPGRPDYATSLARRPRRRHATGCRPRWTSRSGPAGSTTRPRTRRSRRVDQLMTIYDQSVGRGANLLLNIPPDRRGLISRHRRRAAARRSGRRSTRPTATDLAQGRPRATATERARAGSDVRRGARQRRQGRHLLGGRRRGDERERDAGVRQARRGSSGWCCRSSSASVSGSRRSTVEAEVDGAWKTVGRGHDDRLQADRPMRADDGRPRAGEHRPAHGRAPRWRPSPCIRRRAVFHRPDPEASVSDSAGLQACAPAPRCPTSSRAP